MKIIQVEQNSPEWLELRKGKITGSKLKDIVTLKGNGTKIGFYQLIADRLAVENTLEEDEEKEHDRGHRLEDEALALFSEMTGKTVTKGGMWISEENENIACSPDGSIYEGDIIPEAAEVKCLKSARHIEALITQEIPSEYTAQKIQYFILNEDLQKLYFLFYDPRVTVKPLFWITVNREDIEEEIEFYKDYQNQTLERVNKIVEELSF